MIAKLGAVFRFIAGLALLASVLGGLLGLVLLVFGEWALAWYLIVAVVVGFGAVRLNAVNRRHHERQAAEVVAEAESYLLRKS